MPSGLTADQARARLARDGPNELDQVPPLPLWRRFLRQFANTMIVVLLIAAAVTIAIGEPADALVIMVIVVLNAVIGFVQEDRAERAVAALSTVMASTARVMRDGRHLDIAARDVVTGDVLVLSAGDVVAADARLVEAAALRVNEAALTGESAPVDKSASGPDPPKSEAADERRSRVFKGTPVVHGRGLALVTHTGMNTELGRIAHLLQSHGPVATPLQRRLAVLGRRLAMVSLALCAIVFGVGVASGEDVGLMFLTAVSLAVAAIPEALPAVVTISLAFGARRMSQHNALVRSLPAVETLGSVTVICSDKTGTLTQGRMQIERVWCPDGELAVSGNGYEPVGDFIDEDGSVVDLAAYPSLRALMTAGVLCNDAALAPPADERTEWNVVGDPTEGALLVLAAKAGLDDVAGQMTRLAEVPFDAARKIMTTIHAAADGGVAVSCKGAVEGVLRRVTTIASARTGSPTDSATVRRVAERYAANGYRVLALAGRRMTTPPAVADHAERDLELFGLVAMADPLRPGVVEAVRACGDAGIIPVMITGDHPSTATAIADRVGLLEDRVVATGAELTAASAQLRDRVADIGVYARTTPEQKLAIISGWHDRGDTVAMTGDGVNDAPALRAADIGVAMGITGTEVAKEAADMVLADDNFATIVNAVREGRRIYDNIRRFVRYTLTSNTGEIWVMVLGPFVGLPLPLLPVHILWINLVTDGLPGLALGVEQPERDVMHRPPRPPAENIFARGLWQHVGLVGLLMGVIPLCLGLWGFAQGRPWQTMVFTSLALLQLGHALAVRSERDSLFLLGLRTNTPLLAAVAGTLAIQMAAVYTQVGQRLLHLQPLGPAELLAVLAASSGVFWAVELEKLLRRRGRTQQKVAPP